MQFTYCQVSLMNMFLKQRQGGHAAMASNFIIRNDHNVNQRESTAVEFACQRLPI
ncbi:Uncharacterised protein [Yokenella regensburgei]|uniref:Uncharacterized protein n=1 Tax=Yokenella regensburgei TaxID=158877 RepID=A0AB38FVH5_9ENTR|nr:Uncharacterised protein [Yokenella regensburgei]SQB02197.1 Uncharacterised protein [Yokenella regensburgei]SUQ07501.1 Uncharacterised protein [Yokenella regensburgei]